VEEALKVVEKAWGREEWLVNNELYCCKFLRINPGWQCSWHRHKVKDETFFVLNGDVRLESEDIRHHPIYEALGAGDERRIRPGTLHMFGSKTGATILEVSTHHDDEDVERLTSSHPITESAVDPFAVVK
jgi:mannose-6-phosphate isomerase-like protein (cupin superfamily)